MSEQLRSSIVRIYDRYSKVVGVGFLVTAREILTCAHVVAQAVGIPESTQEKPNREIQLDFPLVARDKLLPATIVLWRPVGFSPKEEEDIAVLSLKQNKPDSARAVRIVTSDEFWGHAFRAFGSPGRYDHGVWASGRLLEREATGWVQIEDVKEPGFGIQPGFSGSPVWDEHLNGVAGMIVAAEKQSEIKAAFIIPADTLAKAWPTLEAETIPPCPYRGLLVFREQDAPFFFGREVITMQLVEATRKKSLIALIGPSGSGKSSVVFAGLMPLLPHIACAPFFSVEKEALSAETPASFSSAQFPQGKWIIAHFRPGHDPFQSLVTVLTPLLEPHMSQTDRLIENRKLTTTLRQGELSLLEVVEQIIRTTPNANRLLLFID